MDLLTNPFILGGISLIIIIYSAILHEIAHGIVAERLGDPTARLQGRITLDPRPHIDPILTIILPLSLFLFNSPIIFGGAKPVPVDPFNLRDGRKDLALVSLAGPLTNIIIAVFAAILTHLLYPSAGLGFIQNSSIFGYILAQVILLNLALAVFNLLPIPPLDGSKIFALLLPESQANSYLSLGSIGFLIFFVLLSFPIGGFSLMGFIYTLITFLLSLLGF